MATDKMTEIYRDFWGAKVSLHVRLPDGEQKEYFGGKLSSIDELDKTWIIILEYSKGKNIIVHVPIGYFFAMREQ
jgi:ribosome maturation factor RimP